MARTDDTTEPTSVPRNDAYTGMLIVSLIALLAGTLLLFLDWNQYPDKNPPKVIKVVPEAAVPADQKDEAQPNIPAPKADKKK
jgi:hypothetical protein